VNEGSEDPPEYHRSEKLQLVKRFVCVASAEKPRQPIWLTKQLRNQDLYERTSRLAQNIRRVIEDPRTPVEKRGKVVVNTEADYE
jgi:hypothetical protein